MEKKDKGVEEITIRLDCPAKLGVVDIDPIHLPSPPPPFYHFSFRTQRRCKYTEHNTLAHPPLFFGFGQDVCLDDFAFPPD